MRKLLTVLLLSAVCGCLEAKKSDPVLDIIPQPLSTTFTKGSFKVKGANFNYEASLEKRTINAIAKLADDIYIGSGKTSSLAMAHGVDAGTPISELKGFFFLKDPSLEAEEYVLEISPKAVKVTSSGHNGFIYAISSLRQMMPVEIYSGRTSTSAKWFIPCCVIKDKPRFAYRGLHLDVARHFFNVEQVKRYLDVAAMYKINRFHWHLTEDQGWRIEIKKYPALTETGAFRSGTQQDYDRSKNDGKRYGGYYTQAQVKEIVEYADALGITVIPEIDLPGHMVAALATYPELGCTGGPYEVRTSWGVAKDVLCVGKEATFEFIFNVLDEVCELFPGEYIHIGGDECPKDRWNACPVCQAKMDELRLKDDENGTRGQRLQNYVTKRVQDYLAQKGRKIIGWDEILEGDLAKGATVMSWRGVKGGLKASALGFDVIMSPNTYCYFDYKQDYTDNTIGANYTKRKGFDARNVYSYEPLEGLDAVSASHILGVQANMWTEFIRNDKELYFMLIPRLQALSEVQWSTPENRSYERFTSKMKDRHFKIMDLLGYGYCTIL